MERAENHRVGHAENGGGGAYSQRQSNGSGSGKAGAAAEHPKTEVEILEGGAGQCLELHTDMTPAACQAFVLFLGSGFVGRRFGSSHCVSSGPFRNLSYNFCFGQRRATV